MKFSERLWLPLFGLIAGCALALPLLNERLASAAPTSAGAASIEQAFSPEGGAEQLAIKCIRSAQRGEPLRLAGYSFTSPVITRALLESKDTGADVAVLVDERSNLRDDTTGKARAALDLLANANANIPTRTIGAYAIHHDKYIVAGNSVCTGSFNFTTSAARRNSENIIAIWNSPPTAAAYLAHWESRWRQGVDYKSTY